MRTYQLTAAYAAILGVALAEVPQEHSHGFLIDAVNTNLKLNNPNNIQDAVFGLLGDAAAAAGAGTITNLACLHQATADQAFTNAKAAGDVDGQITALLYAAVERNTGQVGLASAACTDAAVNPEIAAIQQHQDPAGDGAAAGNKQITLNLAQQISTLGGDPRLALISGTFAPGQIGDPTAAGNTCDDANDALGCIFSQNLIVPDATEAEVTAAAPAAAKRAATVALSANEQAALDATLQAAGGASAGAAAAASNASAASAGAASASAASAGAAAADSASAAASNASAASAGSASAASASSGSAAAAAGSAAAGSAAAASGSAAAASAASGTNVQTFTGTLGGAPPPVASTAGSARAFSVDGSTFVNQGAAVQRSCSVQHTNCANQANSGSATFSVSDCDQQLDACNAAGNVAKRAAASGTNVQTFTGTLGGAAPPVASTAGSARAFSVDGSTFVNQGAAVQRSCSVQHTNCANQANSGSATFSVSDCDTQLNACNAASSAKRLVKARRIVKERQNQALDFGSCASPAIKFSSDNADRPGQAAFAPVDTTDFNHGSALNIGVIAQFTCQQLQSKCKASASAISACATAQTAAGAATGQAAADAFNSALGVTA